MGGCSVRQKDPWLRGSPARTAGLGHRGRRLFLLPFRVWWGSRDVLLARVVHAGFELVDHCFKCVDVGGLRAELLAVRVCFREEISISQKCSDISNHF